VLFVVTASIGVISAVAGGERSLPDRARAPAWWISVVTLAVAGVLLLAVVGLTVLDPDT
jgi:hypothetical protein